MSQIIATFFYVGYMRPAPGTWGSLAALPLAWIIIQLSGFSGLVLTTLIVFTLGLWATKAETAGREDHDPSEIVMHTEATRMAQLSYTHTNRAPPQKHKVRED